MLLNPYTDWVSNKIKKLPKTKKLHKICAYWSAQTA